MTRRRWFGILLLILLLWGISGRMYGQVKIGDNHTNINAGSLLELESKTKGVLFPRISLENDLTIWKLDGTPADGMVVYNTNSHNTLGLYIWYNQQWNLLGGGNGSDEDFVSFDNNTRTLNDDGDLATIPSGRVRTVSSEDDLLNFLKKKTPTEGDIYNLPGTGLYIRNDSVDATTVDGGYIFVPTSTEPGYFLYTSFTASSDSLIDAKKYIKGLNQAFYIKPESGATFKVTEPPVTGGYYAFAIPSDWPTPRIFLKVANSNGGFFKLDNCWRVARNLEYNGVKYQVWALDVPLTASVMDPDLEFRIE